MRFSLFWRPNYENFIFLQHEFRNGRNLYAQGMKIRPAIPEWGVRDGRHLVRNDLNFLRIFHLE